MKRILLVLFAMSCLYANAQDTYKKLLTDGKVWKCQLVSDYVSAVVYEPYTVSVEGDTIVDGRECKKLSAVYDKDGWVMYGYTDLIAYEENGKVYAYKCPFTDETEGDWALMLDFTLHKGCGATKKRVHSGNGRYRGGEW